MLDCKNMGDVRRAKKGEEVVAYGVEITEHDGTTRWMKGGDGLPWFGPESAAQLYANERDAQFSPRLRYAVKRQVIVVGRLIED